MSGSGQAKAVNSVQKEPLEQGPWKHSQGPRQQEYLYVPQTYHLKFTVPFAMFAVVSQVYATWNGGSRGIALTVADEVPRS